jgi:hypothetical protein
MGDAAARLAYLSNQDLTNDKESLAILIHFLKSKAPLKLLGMTIQKNERLLLHTIRALSSTPAPIVRQTLERLSERFPGTKIGQAAAGILKEFKAADKPGIQADHMLTGDLDLFGLPDLLRQLNLMQATGTLTLKDAKGNPAGDFVLYAGRMQDCSQGRLQGVDAAYQFLEKPISGTFVFHGQRNSGIQEQPEEDKTHDLASVLAEGMRRYDELQRMRALAPDYCILQRSGAQPIARHGQEDVELFDLIWQKTATGTSPEECEAICPADSYRVRAVLARWIEEGVLTVE